MELTVILPYKYSPRTYQKEIFEQYNKGIRRFVLVWHRRSGKDKTMLNFMICRMMERRGTYWYVLPTYEQARKTIWEGMGSGVNEGFPFIDHFPEELIVNKNEQRMTIYLINGSIFQLVGSDRVDSVVGSNPVGVIMSEYSLQTVAAWEYISPMLLENKGWASFIFTPRGRNHAFFLWEQASKLKSWYTSIKTVDDTFRDAAAIPEYDIPAESGLPVLTEEMLNEERARGQSEDLIQQEYYCSFVGFREGSYYGQMLAALYKDNRIRDLSWDPKYPVFTAWDLGIADQTAIWFAQKVGNEIFLIDYYQDDAKGLVHYIKLVKSKPYVYSNHYAPHDIQVREFTHGKSRREVARDLGINFRVTPKLGVIEGIDYARTILPRCYFDKTKCDLGIRALINYHKDFNQKMLDYKWHPVHDKWSHGADAFRYLCYGIDNEVYERDIPVEYQRDFDIFADRSQQQFQRDPYQWTGPSWQQDNSIYTTRPQYVIQGPFGEEDK